MRGTQRGNGNVLLLSPHGKVTWNSPATEQGSRRWWKRNGDIHGVLSVDIEVVGMPSRRMSGKAEQPRGAYGTLHVSTLEVEGGDTTGGNGTATKVCSMKDAYSRS